MSQTALYYYEDSTQEWASVSRAPVPSDPVTPPASTTLWEADLSQSTLQAAFNFTQIDGGYSSYGSLVNTTIGGESRGFRNTVSTAAAGYRGQTELVTVQPTNFPRQQAALEFTMRFDSFGGLKSSDVKLGYGLAGAPAGSHMGLISSGGTKYANSWSARTTCVPANYVYSGHPWCLASYLYAERAGGVDIQTYGIRHMWRHNGEYFSPQAGQEWRQRIEIGMNAPGVEDGFYRVFVDGLLYLNIPVMWNPAGQDIPIGYFITQTFANNTVAQGTITLSKPILKELA